MMQILRAWFSGWYLRRHIWSTTTLKTLLGVLGLLWTAVEAGEWALRALEKTYDTPSWAAWAFVGLAAAGTLWLRRPGRTWTATVDDQDVEVCITLGDVFRQEGAMVVPTTTTFDFDVDGKVLHQDSVNGQWVKRNFASSQLAGEHIDKRLEGLSRPEATHSRSGRTIWPVGTTIRCELKESTAYLTALSTMNDKYTARTELRDLQEALPKLWMAIAERNDLEDLVVPVIGAGRARVRQKMDRLIREIIASFVAATAESVVSKRLTIMIRPQDAVRNDLDLADLADYAHCMCRTVGVAGNGGDDQPGGIPVATSADSSVDDTDDRDDGES